MRKERKCPSVRVIERTLEAGSLSLFQGHFEKQSSSGKITRDCSDNAMRRVVVTGLGAVTPLGVGVKNAWSRLIAGHIGVTSLKERGPAFDALPSRVAGLVPHGKAVDGGWDASQWATHGEQSRMALFTQYAMAAAEEALRDAGYKPSTRQQKEAMGVCVGSGIGNFDDVYKTSVAYSTGGYKTVSPYFVPRLLINLAAGHIAMRFGLQGPNTAPTTACTTSAHAIGDAARAIAFGDADVMLTGAAESCIHPLAIAGFARARSLSTAYNDSPAKASRPFDVARDGFVMGEGAGILLLEELEHAQARNATIYSEILGYGLSCDASHITAPLATGYGAFLAMSRALGHASRTPRAIKPSEVDYINAHATGTALGDVAEVRAILNACGDDFHGAPRVLNISSSKGAMGHLLGAAGAVEAVFTILALKTGILPPTANLDNIGLGSELQDEMDSRGQRINFVPRTAQHGQDLRVALSNSFGFGGTNASLCFGRWDANAE